MFCNTNKYSYNLIYGDGQIGDSSINSSDGITVAWIEAGIIRDLDTIACIESAKSQTSPVMISLIMCIFQRAIKSSKIINGTVGKRIWDLESKVLFSQHLLGLCLWFQQSWTGSKTSIVTISKPCHHTNRDMEPYVYGYHYLQVASSHPINHDGPDPIGKQPEKLVSRTRIESLNSIKQIKLRFWRDAQLSTLPGTTDKKTS